MSAPQLRQNLHEFIETADESVIEAMYAVVQSLALDVPSIVAFTASGDPLTKEDFIARIRASYAAGKNGQTKTSEQVLEDVAQW